MPTHAPRDYPRSRRVGQQIQRELVELIRREVKDPRIGLISITAVEVSKDIAYANIFVSAFGEVDGSGDEADESVAILNDASGYLRHLLGKEMRLRTVPQLRFKADNSIAEGMRMSAIIAAAVDSDKHIDESTDTDDGSEQASND